MSNNACNLIETMHPHSNVQSAILMFRAGGSFKNSGVQNWPISANLRQITLMGLGRDFLPKIYFVPEVPPALIFDM